MNILSTENRSQQRTRAKVQGKVSPEKTFLLCFPAATALQVPARVQNHAKLSLIPNHLKDSIFFRSFHSLSSSHIFIACGGREMLLLWRSYEMIISLQKYFWMCDQDSQENQRTTLLSWDTFSSPLYLRLLAKPNSDCAFLLVCIISRWHTYWECSIYI